MIYPSNKGKNLTTSKVMNTRIAGSGGGIVEMLDECTIIVEILISKLQEKTGCDYQSELQSQLHEIWGNDFNVLLCVGEIPLYHSRFVDTGLIVLTGYGESGTDKENPDIIIGVKPIGDADISENGIEDFGSSADFINQLRLILKKNGDVVSNQIMIEKLHEECSGNLINQAKMVQYAHFARLREVGLALRAKAVKLAIRGDRSPDVSQIATDDDEEGGTNLSNLLPPADEENEAKPNTPFTRGIKLEADDEGITASGGTLAESTIFVVGSDYNASNKMVRVLMKAEETIDPRWIIVTDDELHAELMLHSADWNAFRTKYKGGKCNAEGFNMLESSVSKIRTISATNNKKATMDFKSNLNKVLSQDLIVEMNKKLKELRAADPSIVESPKLLWELVQELSLKPLLNFDQVTLENKIKASIDLSTSLLTKAHNKRYAEHSKRGNLDNLLGIDEVLSGLEHMKTSWYRLYTDTYHMPRILKWSSLITYVGPWNAFVEQEHYKRELNEILSGVSSADSEDEYKKVWNLYRDKLQQFISEETQYYEHVRECSNDVKPLSAFLSTTSITGDGGASNPSRKKGKGSPGNSSTSKWKPNANTLTEAETQKVVSAGKEAANVRSTNANNYKEVMTYITAKAKALFPSKSLPPETLFCNNCGHHGCYRGLCPKCNPTPKVLMAYGNKSHLFGLGGGMMLGGELVDPDDIIFMDSGCEALMILSNSDGVSNVRDAHQSIETVDGSRLIIKRSGEVLGEKVLIDSTVKHSLLGLNTLIQVLGDRSTYRGTSEGIELCYDGEVFYTGYSTPQCKIATGSKSKLMEALARISDKMDNVADKNILKVMITRTRASYKADIVETDMGISAAPIDAPDDDFTNHQKELSKVGKKRNKRGRRSKRSKPKGDDISDSTNHDSVSVSPDDQTFVNGSDRFKRVTRGSSKAEVSCEDNQVAGDKESGTHITPSSDSEVRDCDDVGNGGGDLIDPISDTNIAQPIADLGTNNAVISLTNQAQLQNSTEAAYVPEALKSGTVTPVEGVTVWLDEETDENELVINMKRVPAGNSNPIDTNVSLRVKYAYTFSMMLHKTSERSIKQLLKSQPELLQYFDLDDWKIAHKSYLQPSLMLATQRKKFQRGGTLHTNVPGEIIHMDIMQLGGATKKHEGGRTQLALLVIDHYSRFELVIPFDSKLSSDVTAAIDEAIRLIKVYCARSRITGAGDVREIRTDADPIFKSVTKDYQRRGIWLKLGGTNYHERISEANIQHTKDLISLVCEQLPIEPPCWLVVLFLIGVVWWKNLIPKGTDRQSPYEKLTGLSVRYDRLIKAGTGQLGVIRRSDSEMKKRPRFIEGGNLREDSMVSRVRGVLAIAIGPDYNNMNALMVLPLRSDHMTARHANTMVSSPDFRAIPACAELFPTCFPRKQLGALGRFCAANHWLTWEVQLMMDTLNTSSSHHGVSDEEEVVEIDEVICVRALEAQMNGSDNTTAEGVNATEHIEVSIEGDDDGSLTDALTKVLMTVREWEPCATNLVCDLKSTVNSLESIHANEVLSYTESANTLYKSDTDELEDSRDECLVSEIAEEQVIRAFMVRGYIRDAMADRQVNLGLDLFLKLKGSHYWSSPEENQMAETFAREIVDEVIRDNTTPSQLLYQPLWNGDKADRSNGSSSSSSGGGTETDIPKCFYSSKPMTIRESQKMKDPKLRQDAVDAVSAEMNSLKKNGVIEPVKFNDVPIHHRKNILRSFIFIVQKYNSIGEYLKTKARCCANGANQSIETYSSNTASPVCNRLIVMLTIQLSMRPGWMMNSFDIPCAFQQCDEPRELYCWIEKDLYRLRKTLYGSKHAAYVFFINVRKLLVDNGWTPTSLDGGTYSFRKNGDTVAVLCIHVDDVLCSYSDQTVFDNLMLCIRKRFGEEVEVEDASSFLGMNIAQCEDHIHVSMPGFLETLGDSIDIADDIKLYHKKKWDDDRSPWDGTALRQKQPVEGSEDPEDQPANRQKYMTVVGLLMYCVGLRPEIQPQVGYLSSNQQHPTLRHWKAAVRIMHYLRSTYTEGIRFNPIEMVNGKICLTGTADSAYNQGNGRTTCGGTLALGFNATPFGCFSKKMPESGSSTEAEVKGMTYISSIVVWIRHILMYVYLLDIDASIIECDNKPSNAYMINSCMTTNMRHVNPKFWMSRSLYQNQEVVFAWVTTEQLLADTLTKPLSVKRWRKFKKRLLGMTDREDRRRELTLPNETRIFTEEAEGNNDEHSNGGNESNVFRPSMVTR